MKISKKDLLRIIKENLDEAEHNYHYGKGSDMDTTAPTPYYSDGIHRMSGRGTGHFGSGMYFSTYTVDEVKDADDKYGEYSTYMNSNPNLIRVDNSLYRVDFEIYKNLYRVKNRRHGDFLFKTLNYINSLLYRSGDSLQNGQVPAGFSNDYLIVSNNLTKLGLKTPPYREFIKLFMKAYNDYHSVKTSRTDMGNEMYASMSTRMIEYSGFNGVNVSKIPGYDNTTHGSVIYDLSKLSRQPIEVDLSKMDIFDDIKNDVIGDSMGLETKLLRGGQLSINLREFNRLPEERQIFIMKRYQHLINQFDLDEIESEKVKRIYFKTLPLKLRNGILEDKAAPNKYELTPILDNAFGIVYDPNIFIGGNTFLNYMFINLYNFSEEINKKVILGIPRPLTPEEKENYDYYREDNKQYYDWLK